MFHAGPSEGALNIKPVAKCRLSQAHHPRVLQPAAPPSPKRTQALGYTHAFQSQSYPSRLLTHISNLPGTPTTNMIPVSPCGPAKRGGPPVPHWCQGLVSARSEGEKREEGKGRGGDIERCGQDTIPETLRPSQHSSRGLSSQEVTWSA